MPTSDFQFLSDREREYLDDPESFDQQERAEIRYRIREKYAPTTDDISLLEDNLELWDKKVKADGNYKIDCLNCGKERSLPAYRYAESGYLVGMPASGWAMAEYDGALGLDGEKNYFFRGACIKCWETARNTPERVKEEGMVPCSAHGQHKITGKTGCEYIPFTEEEIDDLREEWEDRRHKTCPDCGKPQSELREGTYEVSHRGELLEFEGLVCDCGWGGPEYALSFVKE